MKHAKILKTYLKLENELNHEIRENLKRLDKDFNEWDEDALDFFTYDVIVQQQITRINREGTISFEYQEDIPIDKCVDNAIISFFDALSILDSLENL